VFANSHKQGSVFSDVIFNSSKSAQKRIAVVGAEPVINGTIGALTDDTGTLVTFQEIDSLLQHIDMKKLSNYAPLEGYPMFLEAMTHLCFESYMPKRHIASTAVAGGLAGIRQAIFNYTEIGDSVIIPDWNWAPYYTIMSDNYRKVTEFSMIHDNAFNLESFKQTVSAVAEEQKTVFIIFNSPAHNPTGYSVKKDEWDAIINFLNGIDRNIILFQDVAYIDFSDPEQKALFQWLDACKDHILSIVNYSISKGYAKYGLRTAALFALHNDDAVLQEFKNIITISNRSCYGSSPATGQLLMAALWNDKDSLDSFFKTRAYWHGILKQRAQTFLKNVDPQLIMPFDDGFFVSLKSDHPAQDVAALMEKDVFLVPLPHGIRIALCSVPDAKLARCAEIVNATVTVSV